MNSALAQRLEIEYYEKKFAPKRCKKQISKKEEEQYFCFIERLIKRYKKICNQKDEEVLKLSKKNNYCKNSSDFSFKDLNVVEKAIDKNKFDGKATFIFKNGKRVKTYNYFSILYVAKILKTAKESGKNTFADFVMIPDVVYVVRKIKENEFQDLDRFMGNLKRIRKI